MTAPSDAAGRAGPGFSPQAVRSQIRKVLNSRTFAHSNRLARFLEFAAQQALEGKADQLKESVLAIEVFGRDGSYDPKTDAAVRVAAGKLRSKLIEYYASEGVADPIRIEIPKGNYAPVFTASNDLPAWPRLRVGPRHVAALAACAFVAGLTVYWLISSRRPQQPGRGDLSSVAVLPFVNLSPEPDGDYFSDGLTEELIDALAQVQGLHVVARTSVFQFKGKTQDVREIGRQLNAAAVVEGSVRRSGDRLRVTVQLSKATDGYYLWSQSYDSQIKDTLAIHQEIARSIVAALQPRLASSFAPRPAAPANLDPEAHEFYLRGRHFAKQFTKEGYKKAVREYEKAIARAPNYAPAYADLAWIHLTQGAQLHLLPSREAVSKAQTALSRALELDESFWGSHVTLGDFKLALQWDWAGAERAYQRAIHLNPSAEHAHISYGRLLAKRGQQEQSVQQLEAAVRLDPLSAESRTILAEVLFYAGRYDDAIEQCRKTLELHPNTGGAYGYLGLTQLRKGQHEEAAQSFHQAASVTGIKGNLGFLSGMAQVYVASGNGVEARRMLDQLLDESRKGYVSPMVLARVYATLGENDQVFRALEKGYSQRDPLMLWLKVDPRFESLHSDPRYTGLLRRMGIWDGG